MNLDRNELSTILAALRMFQAAYTGKDAKAIRQDWPEHFRGIKPLGTDDISGLCEKLCCDDDPESETIKLFSIFAAHIGTSCRPQWFSDDEAWELFVAADEKRRAVIANR